MDIDPINKDLGLLAVQALKDSLSHGVCFNINIHLYMSFYNMQGTKDSVYDCWGPINPDSLRNTHQLTVVGYDDTISTASGHGAFKVLDSSDWLNGGHYYIDYAWFIGDPQGHRAVFLEEDFGYQPELTLNLQLDSSITGEDIVKRRYFFSDQVHYGDIYGVKGYFDYPDYGSYYCYPNLVRLNEINGKAVDNQNGSDYNYGKAYLPLHNHDGNHDILFDISDYVKADSFRTMSVIVSDPISASYEDANGSILYSYTRTPQAVVSDPYIKYVGTDKVIKGRIRMLPDTTVTLCDFYSHPAGFYANSDMALIHKSVSTFRRILVTFDVADTTQVTPVELTSFTGSYGTDGVDLKWTTATETDNQGFEVQRREGSDWKDLGFVPGKGTSNEETRYSFTDSVSLSGAYSYRLKQIDLNGSFSFSDTVSVLVTGVGEHGQSMNYSLSQNYPNPFNPATTISFSLVKSGKVSLKVYDLLGREVVTLVDGFMSAGAHSVKFDASRLSSGMYVYRIQSEAYADSKKMILMK